MTLSFLNKSAFSIRMKSKIITKFSYLAVFIALFIISGCDKITDDVVNTKLVDYKIVAITAPSSFSTSTTDSTVTTSVQIQNISSVGAVYCKVETLDQTKTIYSRIDMLDDGNTLADGDKTKGDGTYSCKFVMSKKLSNGNYQVQYFVEDNINFSPDNVEKIGVQVIAYSNNQVNYAPVISNLVIPSTVTRGTAFTFTVKAQDQNGLSDIQSVFYNVYKPDGTKMVNSQGITDFPMADDGNTSVDGDVSSSDGTYSMILAIPASYPAGTWKFVFQAKDASSTLSNQITYNLTVN
jgi:hypothetical protein